MTPEQVIAIIQNQAVTRVQFETGALTFVSVLPLAFDLRDWLSKP